MLKSILQRSSKCESQNTESAIFHLRDPLCHQKLVSTVQGVTLHGRMLNILCVTSKTFLAVIVCFFLVALFKGGSYL